MLIAIAELNARTSNHVLQAHQQRTAAAVTAEAAAAVEANLVAAAGENEPARSQIMRDTLHSLIC